MSEPRQPQPPPEDAPAPGAFPPPPPPPSPPPRAWAPPGAPVPVDAGARQWAMLAHLSGLIALFFLGLAPVGPLVVWLMKRDEHPFVAAQAAEALNFNLSAFIYAVVGGLATALLVVVLVGFLLIPVLIAGFVAWLVLAIRASMLAYRGEPYRYPLTIRFVH